MDAASEPGKVNSDPAGSSIALRLAPGIELLGEYEASAFAQPQYLLRRPDGQVIQLTRLLYLVVCCLDGDHSAADTAAQVSAAFGRPVSVDNVNYLVETKLAPLGVIGTAVAPVLSRSKPSVLGLRFRTRVVPERLHRGFSWALQPLFWAPLVLAALAAFTTVDVWLVATQGGRVLSSVQRAILHPDLLLAVIAISVAVGAFHEIGHATAARYGGAKPGAMGVGIYLMMPVFYTDVTDSYRLNRRGRLRTDLGGLYFNVIAILIAAGVYQATHFAPLLVFLALSQLEMLFQFFPFVRMDGYYVVSDLIGVPNLFAYLGPTIARLLRRDNTTSRSRLELLKPRARTAIAIWVALTVPILALNVVLLGIFAPRIFPTLWTSTRLQARGLAAAARAGDVVGGLNHLTELILVAVPAVGLALIVALLGRRLGRVVTRRAAPRLARIAAAVNQRPGRRALPLLATAAVVALIPLGLVAQRGLQAGSHHRSHLVAVATTSAQVTAPTTTPPAPATGAHPAQVATAPEGPVAIPASSPASSPLAVAFTSVGGSTVTSTPGGRGYWLVKPNGGVSSFGDAGFYGSVAGIRLAAPVVAITATHDGRGYWLVGADGGVFTFGDAGFYGSVAGIHLNQPIVAITPTTDGRGYWLVGADGGVFTFGDAGFYGSVADIRLNQPVSAITSTPSGHGYWLGAGDGGVFTFGDAGFYGSLAHTPLNRPVVAITPTPSGRGYWLAGADGGVFTLGDATFNGSAATIHHPAPVDGILVTGTLTDGTATATDASYHLIAADGAAITPTSAPPPTGSPSPDPRGQPTRGRGSGHDVDDLDPTPPTGRPGPSVPVGQRPVHGPSPPPDADSDR
jgi:putative peptide zinc metalloprotease protein